MVRLLFDQSGEEHICNENNKIGAVHIWLLGVEKIT